MPTGLEQNGDFWEYNMNSARVWQPHMDIPVDTEH